MQEYAKACKVLSLCFKFYIVLVWKTKAMIRIIACADSASSINMYICKYYSYLDNLHANIFEGL